MASKVKALQAWCKAQTDGYRDAEVRNMTSSWKSGLAFCAIIHRYRPDLIDYDILKKEDVFENNKLAFDVAEKELNIAALLDAEDMEAMAVPDKLCICTYVSQYYNYFRNKDKLGGPGIKGKVATKRLPDSKPVGTPQNKKAHNEDDPENWKPEPKAPATNTASVRRGSSMGEQCTICREKVYLMERIIEDAKLYHRRCLREKQRSTLTRSPNSSKLLQKYSDEDHKKTTNQNGYGKENKKPDIKQVHTASKPSGLFTKVHGAPKPYSTASTNDQTKQSNNDTSFSRNHAQVTTTERFNQKTNDKDNGSAKPGYLNGISGKPVHKTFQNSTYTKSDVFSDLHSSRKSTGGQPMDTDDNSSQKYEIVGALVNKFPDDTSNNLNSPQVAYAKSKPFAVNNTAQLKTGPKGNAGDTQMMQGILKTLQGVRQNQQNQPLNKKTELSKTSETVKNDLPKVTQESKSVTNGFHKTTTSKEEPGNIKTNMPKAADVLKTVTNGSHESKTQEDSRAKSWSPSGSTLFEAKEDYTSARSRLKPVEQAKEYTRNKPSDNHGTKLHQDFTHKSGDASKSILKNNDTTTQTTIAMKSHVKPILKQKSEDSIEKEHKIPTRSILRFSNDYESNDDSRSRNKSPPKSILKHDSDDESSSGMSRRKSLSPTRSILKHSENDNDSTEATLRARSTSPPKSILKHSEHDEPKNEPKSILKSKSEDSEHPIAGKTILKKSHEFDNSQESPKSILKKSNEDISRKLDSNLKSNSVDDKSWGDKFKGFFGISKQVKHTTPTKTNLLNNVQLDSSDTEEAMDTDTEPVSANKETIQVEKNSNEMPVPVPRRSILKKTEEKKKSRENEPRHSQSSAFSHIPKAEHSSSSPESSSVFSSSKSSNANSAINENNFSAFNLNDSIDLINIKSEGDIPSDINKSVPKTKSPALKPAWQIEMEARQGIRQKESKVNLNNIAARMDAAQKEKQRQIQEQKGAIDKNNDKPTWQMEAEKRQLARNGEYQDPEKFPKTDVSGKKQAPVLPSYPPNHRPAPPRPTSPPSKHELGDKDLTNIIKKQLGKKGHQNLNSTSESNSAPDFINSEEDIFGRTSNFNGNKGLNRSQAFKISPDNSPRSEVKNSLQRTSDVPSSGVAEWQKEAERRQKVLSTSGFIDPESKKKTDLSDSQKDGSSPISQTTKKKIIPETRFSFSELSYEIDNASETSQPPTPPVRPPWVGRGFRDRPLPSPPDLVPKRKVNAEPKMAAEEIMKELQIIDQDLRVMENKGKILEQQIRKGTDDDMDMDEDELMIKWFELVNQKNEFVRRESELMYKKKQQELEETHEEVEYELRRLMNTPEHKKTASDKVREDTLLQELLETVTQRNSIVDSMEEDRIRYIEEDQEIAEVMALKEFTLSGEKVSPCLQQSSEDGEKKKKDKKDKKDKKKGKKGKGNKQHKTGNGENEKKKREKNKTESVFYDS